MSARRRTVAASQTRSEKDRTSVHARKADRPRQRVLAGGRRGRPTQDEVKSINAAVIEAAHNMFLSDGYNSASMEAIARRAGVSKKTLYSRFPTKTELFTAVVNDQVAAWSAQAGRYDDALPATVRERLEHHAVMFLEAQAQTEAQAFERLLLTEARHFPELVRIYQDTAIRFALDVIARELEAAATQEQRPLRDAHAAAQMFMAAVSSWSSLNSLLGITTTAAERRQIARYRVAVFMEGRAAW